MKFKKDKLIKKNPVERHGQELHLQRSGLSSEYPGDRDTDGL